MFCTVCGATVAPGAQFCPACGTSMAGPPGAQPPATAVYYPPGMNYASWGNRAIGYIIDGLIVGAVMAVIYGIAGTMITGMFGTVFGKDAAGGMCCLWLGLFPIATFAVGLYNRVYLIAQRGATIGQGVMRLKTVDTNGNLLTQGTALIRLLVQVAMSLVPFLPLLDLLWPLWDERKQTLHDKAVSSYVIQLP